MIRVIKTGYPMSTRHGEFKFTCKSCGCEWEADRTDDELHISPPFLPFYTYMKCPNCGCSTNDREIK